MSAYDPAAREAENKKENRTGSESENESENESLYEAILGAVQSDGTLPRDFSLPRPAGEDPKGLRFADGAMDGIALYHMAPGESDIRSLTEVVGLISAGSVDAALECLHLYFSADQFTTMLARIDPLQEWIVAHRDAVDPANLYAFCMTVLRTDRDRESVKFALACLELLDTGRNESARNLVRLLALSDEFTLYALFLMRQWPDANEVIFDTAQHVFGWGRIHAVERLEPETEAIRRWLLQEGWRNTVMAAYSALTCVEKSGVRARMADAALEEGDYEALTALLPALLDEGPVAGIGALTDGEAFLDGYLGYAETYATSVEDYSAVLSLRGYCESCEPPLEKLAGRCAALLDRPACRTLAARAAETGENFDFAKALGVDVTGPVLALLRADYTEHYALLYLLRDAPAALTEAASLAEKALDLDALSTGPADEEGFGPAFAPHRALACTVQFLDVLPGTGERLVCAALGCPVVSCRSLAVRTLGAWKEAGYVFSDAVSAALAALGAAEPNEKVKERLAALS